MKKTTGGYSGEWRVRDLLQPAILQQVRLLPKAPFLSPAILSKFWAPFEMNYTGGPLPYKALKGIIPMLTLICGRC